MGNCIQGAFSSDTTISTPVAINKGGTGQTTAQAALDALAAASGSLVQGDIFIVDASGNVVRLARGSDDQTLVMNGSNPNWETVSGGATVTTVEDVITSTFSSSSTTAVDITGWQLDKPTITSGKCIMTACCSTENSGDASVTLILEEDDVEISRCETNKKKGWGRLYRCSKCVCRRRCGWRYNQNDG